MMKITGLFFILIGFSFVSISQTITVIDEISLEPIENVSIYSDSESIITDKSGKADFSKFKKFDNIIFKHPSFKDLYISYEEIQKSAYLIKLKESIFNLNEVVVSANSWEQNKSEVPNRINVISKSTINFSNSQTTADLLKHSGEVFIQKSQLGGGSPIIRGFSANRILLVVDGIRMNNAIYRSGNLQNVITLDANSIESSEIIFGPGSVIYGSDALGGVMDFHTYSPIFSDTSKMNFKVNAKFRFSSANQEKTEHIDFNFGFTKWAFLTALTYSYYNHLKMGSSGNEEYVRNEYVDSENSLDVIIKNIDKNVQVQTGFSQLNVLQKIKFNPNEKIDFTYGFYYSESSDVPRYDRLIQYKGDELKYAEWFYGPTKWMMNSLTVKYSKEFVLFDKFRFVSAYQDYTESRHDRKFRDNELTNRFDKVKVLSNNLDFEKNLKKDAFIFYGTEVFYNKVFSTGSITDIATDENYLTSSRYPDGSHYMSFAAYISYKKNLSKNFTLNTGLRYNKVLAKAELDTSYFDFPFTTIFLNTGAVNGSIGIIYKPGSWQFSINASSGFRAPNFDDLAKVFDSEPGNVVVPNDDLVSELAYNIDFGIQKIIADRIQFDAAVFYTYLDNAMVRSDFKFNGLDSILYDGEMSKVQAVVNADYAKLYGFQISLNAELTNSLSLKSNYSYTSGKESGDKPVRHVPPSYGSTHLIYKTNKFKIDLNAEYNGEITYDKLADTERSKAYMYATDNEGNPYSPSWYTINLSTSYQFSKIFRIQAGIENVLDNRYRPYSSGIVAPGRNFIFALNIKF